MKVEINEAYIENPGIECDLLIINNEPNKVRVRLVFNSSVKEDIFLPEALLPNNKLQHQVFSIQDLQSDLYLDYHGQNIPMDYPYIENNLFLLNPNAKAGFECDLSRYFYFKSNNNYRICYSEFLPLISKERLHVYSEEEGSEKKPIFYRLRSALVGFKTL